MVDPGGEFMGSRPPLHPNKTVSFYYLSDTNILGTTGLHVTTQHQVSNIYISGNISCRKTNSVFPESKWGPILPKIPGFVPAQ